MRSPPAIAVVAAAMLVSAPALLGLAQGSVAPTTALMRFLVDLVACWAGGTLLLTLISRWQQPKGSDLSQDVGSEPTRPTARGE